MCKMDIRNGKRLISIVTSEGVYAEKVFPKRIDHEGNYYYVTRYLLRSLNEALELVEKGTHVLSEEVQKDVDNVLSKLA